jgi:hypothetical protein
MSLQPQVPRPALKSGLVYVKRNDGFFVGRRERSLLFQQELANRVIPLMTGKYTDSEIALLVDESIDDVSEIVDELNRAEMLDDDAPSKSGNENWPELQLTTHQQGVKDGGRKTLQERAHARVDIYGCGLIGASIARVLAASGVGELRLIDQRSITSQHLPVTSLASVGVNAARDLEHAISRDYPKVLGRKIKQPSLVIITRPPTPNEILTWMNFSFTHLIIESRGDAIELGPLVIPGKSSCLRCLTLNRLDRDPNWYSVELCGQNEHEPPAALAQLAAGIGALTALSLLDSGGTSAQAPLLDTTLRIDADLTFSAVARRRHPRCGCAWS